MLDTLETLKATAGRILGVDFGDVRTGLAVSDEARFLAQGIGYIRVSGMAKAAAAVAEAPAPSTPSPSPRLCVKPPVFPWPPSTSA